MIRIGGSISVHGCCFILLLIHLWVYLAVGSLIRIGGSTSVILFLLVHSNSFGFLAFLVSFFLFLECYACRSTHLFACTELLTFLALLFDIVDFCFSAYLSCSVGFDVFV